MIFFDSNDEIYIVIGIIIFIMCLWSIDQNCAHDNNIKWTSSNFDLSPKARYPDVEQEFGKPDYIDVNSGGGAYWFKKTLKKNGHPYEKIYMLDEAIIHMHPAPHADFLYSSVRVNVPDEKISDVRALSDSVTYDPLKKEITARCHFMGANRATIYLAILLAQGHVSLREIKKENLYGRYIFATIPENSLYDPLAENRYEKYIKSYVDKLN
jgi:hypothetical protein